MPANQSEYICARCGVSLRKWCAKKNTIETSEGPRPNPLWLWKHCCGGGWRSCRQLPIPVKRK
jgi:hypothetical protein